MEVKYTIEDIKTAIDSGMKPVEIASRLGKSKGALSSFMKRHGIQRKKLNLSVDFLEDQIFVQGKSQKEVAAKLDVNITTVNRFIVKYRLKMDVCQKCGDRFHASKNTMKWCSDSCRFWNYVNTREDDECWPWVGKNVTEEGYGRFSFNKGNKPTTMTCPRYAHIDAVGPILDEEDTRHTCDNPICCNPAHLTCGSHGDNMRDCSEREVG